MKKILIVYGTQAGHTHKIAGFIGGELQNRGFAVYTMDAKMVELQNHIENYDGVLVGAPVLMSKYPAPLRKWVKTNATALSLLPSAFFSVCLGILETENQKTQRAEQKIVEDFFTWSGWKPKLSTIFAGALMYSKYGWITKFMMKSIAKRAGHDTDTRHDYEYTNWDDVRKFAHQLANQVEKSIENRRPSYINEEYRFRFSIP